MLFVIVSCSSVQSVVQVTEKYIKLVTSEWISDSKFSTYKLKKQFLIFNYIATSMQLYGSFHVKSTRKLGSPLRFWWNLVCLQYLWVLPYKFSGPYTTSFLIYDYKYFVKIYSIKLTVTLYCIIIWKQNFHWLKTSDGPFKWSLNYGIST